jgi:hypothetical protein
VELRADLPREDVDRLRREEARVGDVARRSPTGHRHRQRIEEGLPVRLRGRILHLAEVQIVAERRRIDRRAVRVVHALRHDQ